MAYGHGDKTEKKCLKTKGRTCLVPLSNDKPKPRTFSVPEKIYTFFLKYSTSTFFFLFQKFYEFPSMNNYQCPQSKSPIREASMAAASEAVQHQSFYNSEIKPESWPPPTHPPPVAAAVQPATHPANATGLSSLDSSDVTMPPLCAGCQLRIEDKFYLTAVDAKWHSACLKCAECGVELETQSSCFERDGHIYCKEDYRR